MINKEHVRFMLLIVYWNSRWGTTFLTKEMKKDLPVFAPEAIGWKCPDEPLICKLRPGGTD
ncbi:MAG: hypothetical protein B6D61_15035 [Bacteroidetes bacterium 4484_249]|nr:MAG: hypothetical protein B6D61_15035 [Bacteroidetes bacterium 4484_249]